MLCKYYVHKGGYFRLLPGIVRTWLVLPACTLLREYTAMYLLEESQNTTHNSYACGVTITSEGYAEISLLTLIVQAKLVVINCSYV